MTGAGLPQGLANDLETLARLMADIREDWWVIGSTAIVLAGVEGIAPHDVDVLISAQAARALAESLGETPLALPPHPKFRSEVFFRRRLVSRDAEFMVGFEVAGEGGWEAFWPVSRRMVGVPGGVIPIPDVEDLKRMCRLFGRARDMEKLARLETLG
jgi:hypothetical protein